MTLREKGARGLDTGAPRGTGREHCTEDKGKRWAGALLALIGALMIALSAGGTLAGGGLGDDASGQNHPASFGGRSVVDVTSGDDIIVGGADDDELYGGPGRDLLIGGSGDDFIEASDRERDYVFCGPGYDTVDADSKDYVADDCEVVYRR